MIGATKIPRLPRPSRISSYVASRVGSPVIDPATVGEVLSRFGLRPERTARNLRLGRRSRNVAVSTNRGVKVVKLYRPQWTEETVGYGHSILLRLEEIRFPASRLLRTAEGETWTRVDGGLFAVFEFVRGANYSLNYLRRADRMRLTSTAATTLADLHRGLTGFVPEGEHHLGLRADGSPVRDVAWFREKLEELRARSRDVEDDEARGLAARISDRGDEVLERIAELEGEIGRAGQPRLVIHGDYGLHNIIFPPSGTPVPVDFEVARYDRRVNDLISAAGKYRFDGGGYDVAAIETFFDAYAASFPVTDVELERLPDAWRLYRLRAAMQYWNSYFETDGPARKLASSLGAIDQAEWVGGHPDVVDRLRRALGGTGR